MIRILKTAWRRWLKIAEVLGNIQMIVLLTLIYWTVVLFMAVPMKVRSDRLALRDPSRGHWVDRDSDLGSLESMRKQG